MLMDLIKNRHSIRKYTDRQISREDLEKILEAGSFAPNAGGGQRSMMVAVHDKEQTTKIGQSKDYRSAIMDEAVSRKGGRDMDLATCFKKMELVGVLAFATVDSAGAPQIRNISAIHYEPDALYFFTARGKNFCRQLQADGRVQILCYTRYKEMIRLSGKAVAVAEEEQAKWRNVIFAEQPYLANVYPGDTREIGIVFCISRAQIEYFNLGVNPIFRETYTLGDVTLEQKGYFITDACIGCGTCQKGCPQRCITAGKPYQIRQEHCLHCGSCYEKCPVKAVERRG